MNTIHSSYELNPPARWGLALLSFVLLFFAAVFLEFCFGNLWLFNHFISPIGRIGWGILGLLCLVFPSIAVLINLTAVLHLQMDFGVNLIRLRMLIKVNVFNWAVIILGVLSLSFLTLYLLLDNGAFILRAIDEISFQLFWWLNYYCEKLF
jgi:hypothetical protein